MSSLFKKPEYRKFNLTPRYWDPKKEVREEREKRIKGELGLQDDQDYTPNIRNQFRREYEKREVARSATNASSTLRFFMILILLFIAAFYVFIKNPEGIMRFFGL